MKTQKRGSGFKVMAIAAVALGAAFASPAANVNVQVAAGQEAYGKVSGGKAGAQRAGGIRIVVCEKREGLWRVAQLLAEPAVEPGEVVEAIHRRFFGENPAERVRR